MTVRFTNDNVLTVTGANLTPLAPDSQVNWDTPRRDTGSIDAVSVVSDGTVDDEIMFQTFLRSSTYAFRLYHTTGPDRGIYEVFLNGVSVDTIDGYTVSVVSGEYSEIAGVAVNTVAQEWTIRMTAKNASSSSFLGAISMVALGKTV
jgi:hypothetical protein